MTNILWLKHLRLQKIMEKINQKFCLGNEKPSALAIRKTKKHISTLAFDANTNLSAYTKNQSQTRVDLTTNHLALVIT